MIRDWTALVPVRPGPGAKSRLEGALAPSARETLVGAMGGHVLGVLDAVEVISRIVVLAPQRPEFWHGEIATDSGSGLNAEIMKWRAVEAPENLLVIHADLPLLCVGDVGALIARSHRLGVAVASDLGGTGTNAVALSEGRRFSFAFGPDSYAAHAAQAPPGATVNRRGLATDIDEPADISRLPHRVLSWLLDGVKAEL